MQYEIITLFPQCFPGPLACGIIGRAIATQLISIRTHNLRDYAIDKHKTVDDKAFGGGAGMVLSPQPLVEAIRNIRKQGGRTVLLSPSGFPLTHERAKALSSYPQLVIVSGRYEGIDQRVIDLEIDEEISVGDFVVTGGELPAMLLIDAVSRFIPEVVGNEESLTQESFVNYLIEYPHYTRPVEFEGLKVPEILLSGNHARIEHWRKEQSILRTKERRPDLLKNFQGEEK
ncbi:MAG TPA: tRNA (guanosine(37)-N1)-methyltransferase TrmD [Bdellovibrionota bacterium]|nr:tRNA (guanosine(37)-N1)-methyltransferase TrmD [Bdellovibrionota bacterium]